MKQILYGLLALFPVTAIGQTDCTNGRYYSPIFQNVDVIPNVTYGANWNTSGQYQSLEVDIYKPAGDTVTNRPLIILAHGGSFVAGDRTSADIVDLCTRFAKMGYVTASMEYRLELVINVALSPDKEKTFMEQVYRTCCDQRSLLRFFNKSVTVDGNPYGINPNQIIIGGNSAGAILSLHTAYLDDINKIPSVIGWQALGHWDTASGNAGYPANVAAVVNLCGALKDSVWLEAGDQPFVSMHGDQDGVVPYMTDTANPGIPITEVSGSYSLHARALNQGVTNPFYTFVGEGHSPFVSNAALMDTVEVFVRDFLFDQLCNQALGTAENNLLSFSIYPNPVSEILYWTSSDTEWIDYTLVDVNGSILRTQRSQGNIDVKDLTPGTYILRWQVGQKTGTTRFIRQ